MSLRKSQRDLGLYWPRVSTEKMRLPLLVLRIMLMRLEHLAVGGSALARQLLDVSFLVQDEDVLSDYYTANLRPRLEDVANCALLVLQMRSGTK